MRVPGHAPSPCRDAGRGYSHRGDDGAGLDGIATEAAEVTKINLSPILSLLGATLYAGLVLSPEARALRAELRQTDAVNESPMVRNRFNTLHRRSVTLNGAVLIGALTALAWAVASPLKSKTK